jgi:hypothetical protein
MLKLAPVIECFFKLVLADLDHSFDFEEVIEIDQAIE